MLGMSCCPSTPEQIPDSKFHDTGTKFSRLKFFIYLCVISIQVMSDIELRCDYRLKISGTRIG